MFRNFKRFMKTFKQFMDEDAPINNVGGGQIAGTKEAGDDPPVNKKKKKNIYLGKLSRTSWLRDVKKNGK
tara:strand:- start:79 stop:288 length:210 start_codon:yes stop_codon:yes gene_type:complete